jgi:uncharacterized protein (DUF433 family)
VTGRAAVEWSREETAMGEKVMTFAESWIQKTPDVVGGDACIRNTRIPVWSLVIARRLGISDRELHNQYVVPLTQADVDAAWAYAAAHPAEIEEAIRENDPDMSTSP